MAKLNIVHIIFIMRVGGAENMLADLVNEQVKTANVSLIVVNRRIDQVLIDRLSPKVKVYYAERSEKSRNPFDLLKIWLWLFKLKADVIHCHQHNLINFLPFWKNKMVVTVHTIGVQVKNLNKYKKVFAISDAVKNDLFKRGRIQSTVIYNGIETPNIKPKMLNEINCSPIFKIVQVSRLRHEVKGQHLAIEAIHILRNIHHLDVELYLVGTGPSLQYLKKLTQKYNLETVLFFLG
jgi:glycosyltransferase involved in cell wall biosynthesis